jgi:hypothetical protein
MCFFDEELDAVNIDSITIHMLQIVEARCDVPLEQQLGISVGQLVSCACLCWSSRCGGTFAHCLWLAGCSRGRIVRRIALGRLHHTKIIQMDDEATTMTPTGWSLWLHEQT